VQRTYGINGHQLYGSRKDTFAYDTLIIVRAIYDMARTQRDYIISLFNDLKGVYDRVRLNLNTITTRRVHLSKKEPMCHAAVLKKLRHFIRTGFGISEDYLIWDCINNPGGLGQGNVSGAPEFHSMMLPLEKNYESETGHEVAYTNPDSSKRFFQWLISYVDENTILVN